MNIKKLIEQTGKTKGGHQEVSEKQKGGGRLDGKAATPTKTKKKSKVKSTEKVRTPN